MVLTAKTWSRIFDVLIILGDMIGGTYLTRQFMPYFGLAENSVATNDNNRFFCALFILLTLMYVSGLLINKVNFIAEKSLKISAWDGIALMFNTVLFAAIFPLILTSVFPFLENMIVFIVLIFALMGAWAWLHWHITQRISSQNGGTPSKKRKIIGFFLVYPFVISVMLPVNALVEGMRFTDAAMQITFQNAFWTPLLVGALLALIAWFLCYIPRKMLKAFTGTNISGFAFFWALVLDFMFKLSPLNFL